MNTWKPVLLGIILFSSGLGARPVGREVAAETDSDGPNGSVRAFQTGEKDKVVSLTVTGKAAELMYNMLTYGHSMPDHIVGEKPKPISKNGLHCEWVADAPKPLEAYACYFAVTSTGISPTYRHKLGGEAK